MDKKICPFMSRNISHSWKECQKEKCMAWGVTSYIFSDGKDEVGNQMKSPVYGCKLIEQKHDLLK